MATTLTVTCPECKKQFKAPADLVGKKIRCKGCEAIFTVKSAPAVKPTSKAKPAAPTEPPPIALRQEEEDDDNPYGVDKLDNVPRCPYCTYEMEEGAIICLNCGYNVHTREHFRTKKVYETTAMDYFLWWLPAFGCILAILLMVGYCVFHHYALPGILIKNWDKVYADKKEDRGDTISAEETPWYAFIFRPEIEVWLAVGALFGSWKAGRFAYKRLVQDNQPPEIEKRT
jgi:hypothetical protein